MPTIYRPAKRRAEARWDAIDSMVASAIAGLVTNRARGDLQTWREVQVTSGTGAGRSLPADEPCEAVFERLATEDPDAFLEWISRGTLAPSDLTFAAEIAGAICEPARSIPLLLALLRHADPLVREGAVLGLAHHVGDTRVRQRLEAIASSDHSSGVRAAADDVLS